MIYNILRGIRLPTGEVWGGDVPADDLPLDNWVTAMNACDAPIGSRASFAAGLEIKLEMEPAEVIDELAKTCLGQVSEMGGVFRMRVGAPAAPVQFITDEDIVISAPQELDPFPGLAASANAIASDYPEPASLWTSRAAPPLFNPTWEAEDGGRRLSTSLNFPACADVSQVAQLMSGLYQGRAALPDASAGPAARGLPAGTARHHRLDQRAQWLQCQDLRGGRDHRPARHHQPGAGAARARSRRLWLDRCAGPAGRRPRHGPRPTPAADHRRLVGGGQHAQGCARPRSPPRHHPVLGRQRGAGRAPRAL
jgi:hypothetical protein